MPSWINLNTPLAEIEFDNSIWIPTEVVGEDVAEYPEWGTAWDQVERAAAVGDCDGTVRDLRDRIRQQIADDNASDAS